MYFDYIVARYQHACFIVFIMKIIRTPRVANVHDARAILLDNVSCQRVSELLPTCWETVERIKHNEFACTHYAALCEESVDRFNRSQHKTIAWLELCYMMLLTCAAIDRKVNIK